MRHAAQNPPPPPADGPQALRLDAADAGSIASAARLLREGHLVAFATETVYGLGADAADADAVARLYKAKARPRFNPLIVHVANLESAREIGRFGPLAMRLAQAFWPGPLTLVVRKAADAPIADLVTAGLDTVALRVPGHASARTLLEAADTPVVAPSANRSGHVSATTADHVLADLGDVIAAVLDDGPTPMGLESTIVDATEQAPPALLRAGAVPREAIEDVIGGALGVPAPGAITAPGQLASHYAPRAALRLNATEALSGETLVAFGSADADPDLALSLSGDLTEASARLFTVLRRLDERGIRKAAVMPVPETGLGEAINDRLRRAAAPRPTMDAGT